jgi:hypothetical protein
MKKSNFTRGMDPLTALDLGNIKIVENWMNLYGLPVDKSSVKRSRREPGQALIELQVDEDMDATLLKENPDWKSGRTGTVKIVFQFED